MIEKTLLPLEFAIPDECLKRLNPSAERRFVGHGYDQMRVIRHQHIRIYPDPVPIHRAGGKLSRSGIHSV